MLFLIHMSKEVINNLKDAVLNYDEEAAKKAAEEAVKANIDPMEAIRSLSGAISEVGERFHRQDIFLPHVVMAADAMQAAVEIIHQSMSSEEVSKSKIGTIVLGTVEGDLHDIGKNIVQMMLVAAGFEVIDLGRDVKVDDFIRRANEVNADLIAVSCLMTTTMPYQREVVEELKRLNLRDKFKVLVGGGPVTQGWADTIGADGYGEDAYKAVDVVKSLLAK
jgi:corrinoid protein of di/trimethylamine methyltransferase